MKKWNITPGSVLYVLVVVALIFALVYFSFFYTPKSTNTTQEKIASIVQDQFIDIDQFAFDGRSLSLDDAEAILYCWAEGEDVSDKDLKEAIRAVLESTDEIRYLIDHIDEIDLNDYS